MTVCIKHGFSYPDGSMECPSCFPQSRPPCAEKLVTLDRLRTQLAEEIKVSNARKKVAENLETQLASKDAELTRLREVAEAARRYSRASGLGDLYTFLEWFADRCVHVYGESENVDFVIAAREKGRALNAALRAYDAGKEG